MRKLLTTTLVAMVLAGAVRSATAGDAEGGSRHANAPFSSGYQPSSRLNESLPQQPHRPQAGF